ncbi:MAG: Hint domain-containing protein [Patescibacteria group bacterium]
MKKTIPFVIAGIVLLGALIWVVVFYPWYGHRGPCRSWEVLHIPLGCIPRWSKCAIADSSDCPVCLSATTNIRTPEGNIPIRDLRKGDLVFTRASNGETITAPIIKTSRTRVSSNYRIIHLALSDGRQLFSSPGHPLPNGKTIEDLRIGDPMEGSAVIESRRVAYPESFVYDILPAGLNDTYWANDILLKSTLAP